MLFKPTIGTDLSGKIGGIVASHNAGGAYFRVASIPTNPNTLQQQAVRSIVGSLTVGWNDTLTPAQRTSWEVYATNVTLTNRIGEQQNVSGLAMYVRSNTARMQVGEARIDDAPTTFNLGLFDRALAGGVTEAGQSVDIDFGADLPIGTWKNLLGSFLLVYVSRPQNPGVTFFKGPYRVAGVLAGDPVPPVSPFTVPVPFPIVAGQRLFTRSVVTYVDGRFTLDIRSNAIVGV